jgi:hypothetical protein
MLRLSVAVVWIVTFFIIPSLEIFLCVVLPFTILITSVSLLGVFKLTVIPFERLFFKDCRFHSALTIVELIKIVKIKNKIVFIFIILSLYISIMLLLYLLYNIKKASVNIF